MSESNEYPTGVYAKGDDVKVANTASRAVALAFEGYKLQTDEVPEPTPAASASVSSTSPVPDVSAKPRPPRTDS